MGGKSVLWTGCLVNESLSPFSSLHLTRVDVALRVHGDAMHPMELARVSAASTESSKDFEGLAVEYPNLLVGSVGNVKELLFGIRRKVRVPTRSGA